jgi:5-bromo-4-chloroindolyl phosphate hydrolysis protein
VKAVKLIKSKSVIPIYSIGLLWLVYSYFFPLYRISDYFIVSLLSLLLYLAVCLVINTFFVKKEYRSIDTGDAYTDELLVSALDNLEKLRLLRSAIWNDNLRKQVQSLENDSRQIVEFIKSNPDKCLHVSQFFLYYLPATLKLVNNYKELEARGQVGKNHTEGIKKIEDFIGELVTAYHKILDDLCEDKVMETSINIDVIEDMLQQDKYLKE